MKLKATAVVVMLIAGVGMYLGGGVGTLVGFGWLVIGSAAAAAFGASLLRRK